MKTDRIAGKAWRAIWQSGLIVILALAAGIFINQVRSDKLALVADWASEARLAADEGESTVISIEEAERLCLDREAIFLDARSPEDYARGHIRCAKNMPWQSFDEYFERLSAIPEHARIVTYCDGQACSLSEDLARELVSMGYEKVKVLLNGWTRWVEAGLPVEIEHKGHSDGRKG